MIQYSWLGLKTAMGEQMKFRTPHTFTEIKLQPDQSSSNHPDSISNKLLITQLDTRQSQHRMQVHQGAHSLANLL
jgi:hypothetical protein